MSNQEISVQRFMSVCTRKVRGEKVAAKALFDAYASWCKHHGCAHLSVSAFGLELVDMGYRKRRVGSVFYLDLVITWQPAATEARGLA